MHLDAEDERLLREMLESPFWAGWQMRRVEVVLGMAAGTKVKDLAERLGLSRSSIQRFCRIFEKEGVAGLITRHCRKGRRTRNFAERAG